jgi:uncharacterized protein (TIGR02679 family)
VTAVDHERVRRLLGGEDTGWLVERLRRRMHRGRSLSGTVTRQPASEAERLAVARLLGRPLRPGGSVSVPLHELEAVLRRAGAAGDLRSAVEALTGPVVDAAAAGAEQEAVWTAVFADAADWTAERDLGGWLEELQRSGLLRRLAGGRPARGRELLEQARRVVAALPAAGIGRARLAAAVLGDSHALDDDRPLTTLVLRAAADLGSAPPVGEFGQATWRREVWAGVGVLVAELSAPVLTVGLRAAATTTTATARLLAAGGAGGEPLHLTLRRLVREAPQWDADPVWICENPAVVAAAADELGARCPPLVCTNGQPSTAVTTLLRQLADAGAPLHYHGDFDWPGLVIAGRIITRLGAVPWRMGAGDYLAAAARSSRPLQGASVASPWDHDLAPTMSARGLRVEEELVLDELLTDLDAAARA